MSGLPPHHAPRQQPSEDGPSAGFLARVDAAFERLGRSAAPSAAPGAEEPIDVVLAALAQGPLPAPHAHLTRVVEQSFAARGTAFERLSRLLAAARTLLLRPEGPEPGMALAGLRGAAAPVTCYTAQRMEGEEAVAWLDLAVETVDGQPEARRLRGTVGLSDPLDAAIAVVATAPDGALLAESTVDEEGAFALVVQAPRVSLVVELDQREELLRLASLELRSS